MRLRATRVRRLAALTLLAAPLWGAGVASASAAASAPRAGQQLRTVTYHGYSVRVPRAWPVYNLAQAPQTCVRFNRHALYLGVPGSDQRCPAQAAGRTEAILVEPARVAAAGDGATPAPPLEGSATTFLAPAHGVRVTATWGRDPQLIARALGRRTLPAASPIRTRAAQMARRIEPHSSGGGATGPTTTGVYVGQGFDTCTTPSSQQMAAWTEHSQYHAIGVYIGGENAACPPGPRNPNLTTTWLDDEAAAGWHFIPTYVGLQAPANGCGCQSIKASQASAEGTADANYAVADAQSLGLPPGTPIYDDMEGYSEGGTNTSAVLSFLAAWTTELHTMGYVSGVYGSDDSTVVDLVSQYGTSYAEPDDIWFAAWPGEGSQTTSDPNIPSADWANNQRIHQYSSQNETHGGVTLNIDSDYLDGATAGAGSAPPPTLSVDPTASGLTHLTATWSGVGIARWEVQAGTSAGSLTGIRSASVQGAQTPITVRSAAPYFAVEAVGPSNQVLAASPSVAAPTRLQLFGRSSFVGQDSQVGTVAVGCYLSTSCHVVAQIYWGSTRIGRSASQGFRSGGDGLVYYRLNWAGRRLVARYHDARLPVEAVVKDASGARATAHMLLIPFATSARGPTRSSTPARAIGAAGTTDFVHGWSGGVLVRCSTVSACWIGATLSSGRTTLATARPQPIGGMELGYVFFALTSAGHRLLADDPGELGVNLKLRSGTSTATARVALVRF